MNAKGQYELGEKIFTRRGNLLTLWQEGAEHFYPERADFTVQRVIGENYADYLMTSYPILVRRDLGNSFGSMLRPTAKEWFHMTVMYQEKVDHDSRQWLEWATKIQRRAMYDRAAQFVRATKEGDHDFAAFGQTVISVELNMDGNGLLFRCWHLRDCVWLEDRQGRVGDFWRKWKPSVRELNLLFPGRIHENVARKLSSDPLSEVNCVHMVMRMEEWDGPELDKKKWGRMPYVSVYYDIDNNHVIEAVAKWDKIYVVPRWMTVSGSQFAFSPALVAGLPEARLLQAQMLTILEAGEKAANPPMVAVKEALRSDVNVYPGGLTYVDIEYDERLGEVLRPITQEVKGIPIGVELLRDSRVLLMEAFYINKLNMPPPGDGTMTAYEVGQRVQEYIRHAIPIFEPMEMDYNGGICEAAFGILLRGGAFGDPRLMPKGLRGAEVDFRFESPLHDAVERQKGAKFMESVELIKIAAEIDQAAGLIIDAKKSVRDALSGIGTPAEWTRSEQQVSEAEQAVVEATNMATAASATEQVGKAVKSVADAQAAGA